MRFFRSIRGKLALVLLAMLLINAVTVTVTLRFNRQLTRLAVQGEAATRLTDTLHSYVYYLKALSEGLFMISAGAQGAGRSFVLEARFSLEALEPRLVSESATSGLVPPEELDEYRELRRQLVARAESTMTLIDELERDKQHLSPEQIDRKQAALHLATADAARLAELANLRAVEVKAQLRERGANLLAAEVELAATSERFVLATTIAAGVLAVLILLFAAGWMIRRITELDRAARDFGLGRLSRRVRVTSRDELGDLALSFNRMADDLQSSSEYLTQILDTITSGLLVLSRDGLIRQINPAFCSRFEYREDDLLGTSVAVLATPKTSANDSAARESDVPTRFWEGNLKRRELSFFTSHGEEVPVEFSSAVMNDGAIVCAVTDISERKRLIVERTAKQSAEAATTAKSAFLASMSHELRTPLNGILGYIQLLDQDTSLSPKQRRALTTMSQSGEHLLTLIDDILDISKIEAGRLDIEVSEVPLVKFLDNLVDNARMRAEQKGLQFLYEVLSELPAAVYADEKRLRQVLINLLGNAIKFTTTGGVVLKVGHHHGKIRFQVEDTGIGIAAEDLKAIFTPFRQLPGRAGSIEGTGLGLAISKQLVDAMGGELSVASKVGQGSKFAVDLELPVVEGWADESGSRPVIIGYQGPRRTILVADDNPENRDLLADVLEPLGFAVVTATDGREAIEVATEAKPDVILMDLRMPVMDGLAATRALRASPALRDIMVIGVSASAFEENRAASLQAGCNDFITKPLRLDVLLDKLQKLLQLDWICQEVAADADGGQADHRTWVVPPAGDVKALLEMARMGDIKGIERILEQLAQRDEAFEPFIAKLSRLAESYRIKQICELLERCEKEAPS